jgi:hypothetical protein
VDGILRERRPVALMMVLVPAVLVLAVLVLTGCVAGRPSAIQKAYDACIARVRAGQQDDIEVAKVMTVDDNGHRITIGRDQDGTGSSGANLTYSALACALGELDAPDALRSAVKSLTPTMGRQYTTWGDYRVTYSHSAHDGFNAVITDGFA